MNKYLEKIAEQVKHNTSNYTVPVIATIVPIAAMGAGKHVDLGIRERHANAGERKLLKSLKKGNLASTMALSAVGGAGAAAAEAYRQHILDEKAKVQTKKIETAIKKVVENQ